MKAPRRGPSGVREAPIHVTAMPDGTVLGITAEGDGSRQGLAAHTKILPVNRESVQMVVTDLKVDADTIRALYPNARLQYSVFHIIQAVNRNFRSWLRVHRRACYPPGGRREAFQTSWLLLKGYKRLSEEQRETAQLFLARHPEVEPFYQAKEMIRRLFASQDVVEAYAWWDMTLKHLEAYPEVINTFHGTYTLLQNHFDRCIAYFRTKPGLQDK